MRPPSSYNMTALGSLPQVVTAMMTFNWPPGLFFLKQTAGFFIFPPLWSVFLVCATLLKPPASVWFTIYVLERPMLRFVQGVLQHYREEREIKQLDARRLPAVNSKWPGEPDLLYDIIKSFNNGYLGMHYVTELRPVIQCVPSADVWTAWSEALGPVFNARMLGTDLVPSSITLLENMLTTLYQIVTSDPDHIKVPHPQHEFTSETHSHLHRQFSVQTLTISKRVICSDGVCSPC